MNMVPEGEPLGMQPPLEYFLDLDIDAQPSDVSCGPTCLSAVYHYWGDAVDLNVLIDEIGQLPGGGTITSSPICQSAGVAILYFSDVCKEMSTHFIS